MRKLAQVILENTVAGKIDSGIATELLRLLKNEKPENSRETAIIGMALKFPLADNVKEFWDNLRNGADCIRELPGARQTDSNALFFRGAGGDFEYAKGGYLEEIDKFDYSFFRLSPKEASLMDPHQRLFLETAWTAIEDAGYGGNKLIGSKTGIYLGYNSVPLYGLIISGINPESASISKVGNIPAVIPSRISYLLNLRGPSMLIDTACSSSLVALHLACQGLRNGECEMAIVGGVKVNLLPVKDQGGIGIESEDGKTRTFDDASNGTGWGEGVAAILIKPLGQALKDRDHIYAVIKGSALNQDGSSIGITAPNVIAQEEVILEAWRDADIDPETISYIEAHGTGTKLGDPIEIEGIRRAFKRYTNRKQFCAIGAVKTNIGHLDSTAGMASLIKAVLALQHREIPPSVHIKRPNRKISFENSPVYVNDRLIPWETGDNKRRCGVSAFGLSGTNCHVILEEAPEITVQANTSPVRILTLSAETEQSLIKLVDIYLEYLEQEHNFDIDDLCYTANTGRGHYSHRLIMILQDVADFKTKLQKLRRAGLNSFPQDEIFHGKHMIVSESKLSRTRGELTREEKRSLDKQAAKELQEIITRLQSGEKLMGMHHEELHKLCDLYTQGADFPWESLYQNEQRRRISLPCYPFQRARCWIEENPFDQSRPVISDQSSLVFRYSSEDLLHPLLHRCVVRTIDSCIFETDFSVGRHWVLSEHLISGQNVIPGTTYLEMAVAGGREYLKKDIAGLKNVQFYTPLVFSGNEIKTIQLTIRKQNEQIHFIVASRQDYALEMQEEEQWMTHAAGELATEHVDAFRTYDIRELYERFGEEQKTAGDMSNSVMTFGPRWQNLKGIRIGTGEALVSLELLPEITNDTQSYTLHPALLDIATSIGGSGVDGFFLPFFYKELYIYKPIPGRCFSLLRPLPDFSKKHEILKYDVEILDENGGPVALIRDFTMKKVPDIQKRMNELSGRHDRFYNMNWVSAGINAVDSEPAGGMLILEDKRGLGAEIAAKLRNSGKKIILASLGKDYRKVHEDHYIITPTERDYERLISELTVFDISRILHLQTIGDKTEPDDANYMQYLDEQQQRGVFSLFNLIKALFKADFKGDIFLIAEYINEVTGLETRIYPENAALMGLGRVIAQEYPGIRCRSIDIDENVSAEDLIKELDFKTDIYQTAYRNGGRYEEVFEGVELPADEAETSIIKNGGVYIITGGTGGIGLEIGKYLASQNNVTLALINRSRLPERSEWDSIISQDPDGKLAARLRKIREIELTGSQIYCYSADVSNLSEMKDVFTDLQHKYGRINGVIHSAGLAGDGIIIRKTEEAFAGVLAPKVKGAWVLERLTRDEAMDFFIIFSSTSSFLSIAGQGDYTAANAFLDSFSAYARLRGKTKKIITINWPAWKETGMAVDYGVNRDAVFKALSTREAIAYFAQILNCNNSLFSRVISGELNYSNELLSQAERIGLKVSGRIRSSILKWGRQSGRKGPNTSPEKYQVEIKGKEHISETEKQLALAWAEVLGLKEISVYDNFYQLGGDSILGIRIINNIRERMHKSVDISSLFEYPTVSGFAAYLDSRDNGRSQETVTGRPVVDNAAQSKGMSYELSGAQKRLWFLQKYDPQMYAYNLPSKFYLDGYLDIETLNQAINLLADRHDSLRTVFSDEDGEPRQIILDKLNYTVEMEDLSLYTKKEDMLQEAFLTEAKFVFDLAKPLLRIKVFKLDDRKHCVFLNIHHIVTDGWSSKILSEELATLYTALITKENYHLEPLKVSYVDWIARQKQWLESKEALSMKDYWLNELANPLPVLNLPLDFNRPPLMTYNGSFVKFKINNQDTINLKSIAGTSNVTLHMMLLSCYFLLLNKITQDDDIIVGLPITGRDRQELERVIGLFVNTICTRINFSNIIFFKDLLSRVKEKSLQGYKNGKYPFDLLVTEINPERDSSRNPIFSTMFQFYENIPQENEVASLFEISLECKEVGGEIEGRFEYNTDLFKHETIERFTVYFTNIVKEVTKHPEIKVAEIEMLSFAEKNQLLYEFNDTAVKYPKDKTIHRLFEEQTEAAPDRIAVIFKERNLTYRELNELANRLARMLAERGIGKGDIVGLMMPRTLETIAGILGILKANAACLPIGSNYPVERVKMILQDSGAKAVLRLKTQETLLLDINEVEFDYEKLAGYSKENPGHTIDSSGLAYIIYTSGSTGNPKGVMLKHSGIVNHAFTKMRVLELTGDDRLSHNLSFNFVASIWLVFAPLFNGGGVVLYDEEVMNNPYKLLTRVVQDGVSVLEIVPSLLNTYLELLKAGQEPIALTGIRKFILTGEKISPELVNKFFQYYEMSLVNAYGQSECSDDTLHYHIPYNLETERVLIGKPSNNTRVYILGKDNRLTPVGVPGELCISGDGLALGYLNNPELTEEKFIPNPYEPGEKMYRTGDLARWRADGNVECLGRIDHQVKIRGNRIELGEIESRLLKNKLIKEVVVIDRENGEGERYLCAYLVSEKGLDITKLREELLRFLPEYMLPSYFIQLDEIPKTSNGKIDRLKLPDPRLGLFFEEESYEAPRDEIEEKLADIWRRILDVEKVGINHDFFHQGGNSLLAIKLQVVMKKENMPVEVADIFKYRTIKQLASFIRGGAMEQFAGQAASARDSYAVFTTSEYTYGSEKKVINGIEPFNEIFYKNCFYNSAFPVAIHFNKSIIPFLINDIGIYVLDKKESGMKLGMEYISCEDISKIIQSEGISIINKNTGTNIMEDIVAAIKNDRPVVIWIDCYYASIRKDMYLKAHWPHTWLIYGYDDKEKKCNIIEHKHKDNLSYERRMVSYDEVVNCYNGFRENFLQNTETPTFYEFYQNADIEINGTMKEQRNDREYIHNCLKTFENNMINKQKEIFSSLEYLKEFADYYKRITLDDPVLIDSLNDLIGGLNDIINAKQVEKYKIERLFGNQCNIINLLEQIINDWGFVRTAVARYIYSNDYVEEEFILSHERLQQLYLKEYEYYQLLLNGEKDWDHSP